MNKLNPVSKEFAQRLLKTIRPGLVSGVGEAKPGGMCIMAAFNYALGRPHGDDGLEDCVECLIELKSPGCQWLDLCEMEAK